MLSVVIIPYIPVAHIISCCLTQGIYPDLWKLESVTPVPKMFPPEKLRDLRRISGLPNFAKITDKLILGVADEFTRDPNLKLGTSPFEIKFSKKIIVTITPGTLYT